MSRVSVMTTALPRRTSYAEILPYAPDRTVATVDLSDNTNRWGLAPAAARALRSAADESITRYPDVYAQPLKEALAGYVGVDPAMIVTGCGSDDVLDAAMRALAEPGARVAIPDPSFAMVATFARMNGLVPVLVPLTATYDLDADAMHACWPSIAYVCSPNNPTGTPVSRAAVEALASRSDLVVIVDEAYAEFAGGHLLDLACRSANILVVRTLSKAFGLAGLRVGYAVGAPLLVAEVEKARGPYKVNALAAAAAVAALREDLPWVRQHIALAVAHRERLCRELRSRRLPAIQSEANFVFVPMAQAQLIASAMRARGVAVRAFHGLPPVSPAHCVRQAIPTPHLVLRSPQFKAHSRRAWGLIVRRHPYRIVENAGDGRPPRFLGNPPDGSPGSWTPVGPTCQAIRHADAAPACVYNEGSQREGFRGSMSRLSV